MNFAVSEKSIFATDHKKRVVILDTAKNIITLYEIQTSKKIKLSIPYLCAIGSGRSYFSD